MVELEAYHVRVKVTNVDIVSLLVTRFSKFRHVVPKSARLILVVVDFNFGGHCHLEKLQPYILKGFLL